MKKKREVIAESTIAGNLGSDQEYYFFVIPARIVQMGRKKDISGMAFLGSMPASPTQRKAPISTNLIGYHSDRGESMQTGNPDCNGCPLKKAVTNHQEEVPHE